MLSVWWAHEMWCIVRKPARSALSGEATCKWSGASNGTYAQKMAYASFYALFAIYKKLTWRGNVRSSTQTLTHAYALSTKTGETRNCTVGRRKNGEKYVEIIPSIKCYLSFIKYEEFIFKHWLKPIFKWWNKRLSETPQCTHTHHLEK